MIRFAIIPLFGNRVAPRCNCTDDFLLVRLRNTEILSQEKIHLNCTEENEWIESIIDLGIEQLICGGIEREHVRRLEAGGIQIISNVAADIDEVLPALAQNRLESWFGYKQIESPPFLPNTVEKKSFADFPPNESEAPCLIDCLKCEDRTCLVGKGCVVDSEFEAISNQRKTFDGRKYSFYLTSLAGAPISRLEDLGSYCRMLQCTRLGLVFCTAVFSEMEWLRSLVDESIQLFPLCCQFGCRRRDQNADPSQALCDPNTLVSILNDANCDLVITIGPCARFNTILDRNSRAPVITTLVKNRKAGGNLFPAAETCEERVQWRLETVC
ncbi:MAG: DUF1847 domain-containing protein [Candidatus Omnitrophica bacterium]|nr:DUF1847 domain-containing protein [Candidatus Omnitrophota bacterium]